MTELDELRELLADTLTPEGVEQWLHGENRLLGGRAVDLLARGEFERVMQAAEAYVSGSYI